MVTFQDRKDHTGTANRIASTIHFEGRTLKIYLHSETSITVKFYYKIFSINQIITEPIMKHFFYIKQYRSHFRPFCFFTNVSNKYKLVKHLDNFFLFFYSYWMCLFVHNAMPALHGNHGQFHFDSRFLIRSLTPSP